MVVNLGLVYKVQHHCGVIFQFVAFIKKHRRTVPDIMAAGGRYDHLVMPPSHHPPAQVLGGVQLSGFSPYQGSLPVDP